MEELYAEGLATCGNPGHASTTARAWRSVDRSTCMSAIRVRSRRLRSRAVVVGACHSAGRSAVSLARLARSGSGGRASWAAASACSASASAASLASHRARSTASSAARLVRWCRPVTSSAAASGENVSGDGAWPTPGDRPHVEPPLSGVQI